LLIVRRVLITLVAALVGAAVLAIVPVGLPSAQGEGDPTMAVSATRGETGLTLTVTGSGCFLPDGVTGADGLLFQLIAPDGSAAASATLLVERDGTWDAPFVIPAGTPVGTYSVRGTCIAPMYEDLGVLAAGTFEVTGEGASAAAAEREPATPRFPSQIENYPGYDGQSSCSPTAKPGMAAFRDMVMRAYPGTTSYGISRDCGVGGTSEHKEGRAWDWANNANDAAGRRRVANFIRWLFATDQYGHRHAMARRLGVMYIIWNRQIFRMYRPGDGWTSYSGSSPHTDHVHISLTRAGGNKRTSFWTMQMDGPNPPPNPPNPPRRGPQAEFEQTNRTVSSEYDTGVSGDFDGNGKADVLWYGIGDRPEAIWWGRQGPSFAVAAMSAPGRFRPLAGDFNGDGRDDIFWYTPGPGPDHVWFGRANRTWRKVDVRVNARFNQSLVGDWDGDGRDDIFWYGPGAAADKVWYGRADGRFVARNTAVSGQYRSASGDFDGDGRSDVLWYAPGAGQDYVWFGRRNRAFDSTERKIPFDQRPVIGDFNGDRRDDIFWYAPGTPADKVWWGRRTRTFVAGGVANVTGNYPARVAGDFDENRVDDIIWYSKGGASPIWWFE
jgi:hypothetical protein